MKNALLLAALTTSLPLSALAGDPEIIVESYADGYNASAFAVDGKWPESAAKSKAAGLRATKSVYNDADVNAGTATFTPDIPVAGKYEVLATYSPSGNASDVIYKVISADGEKVQTFDQNGRLPTANPPAGQWFSLGTYTFEQGTKGRIEITDPATGEVPNTNEPNKRLYADAVRLVPQGHQLPADYTNKATGAAPSTDTASVPPQATGSTAPAAIPTLPSTASAAPTGVGLPPLPGGAGAPVLPPLGGSTTAGPSSAPSSLPALPGAASTGAAASLPSLPGTAAAPPSLPTLPGNQAASALASVPATNPGLPALPGSVPTSTPAPIASSLPGGQVGGQASATAPPGLPALPVTSGPAASTSALPPPPPLGTPATIVGLTGAPAQPSSGPAPASLPLGTPAPEASNPNGLPWSYDYGTALSMATSVGKKVLVFFVAKGNRQAIAYETEIFTNPVVRPLLDNFVLVKVDFPSDTRRGFGLGIYGAGQIAITDPAGTKLGSITQMPETPEAFAQQLEKLK